VTQLSKVTHWPRSASVKQPAGPPALATLRSTPISQTLTRWTLGPILVTDGALVRSVASLAIEHAPALPVGEGYVIAGRPAFRTGCRRPGPLHQGDILALPYVSVTSMGGL
jgi:hypothetical protein